MFLIAIITMTVYYIIGKIFFKRKKIFEYVRHKMSFYKYRTYLELFEASYLIVLHSSYINIYALSFENYMETA